MEKQEYSLLLRMSVIGHGQVGKTTLINTFMGKKFDKNEKPTE